MRGSEISLLSRVCLVLVGLLAFSNFSLAFSLPENFTDSPVIQNLQDPDGFAFSPDGRMFISERISGRLLVAKYDSNGDVWTVNPQPFYTFNTPASVRRSAGLRDIAFDPDFANNGFVYAFYMHNDTLHNRVVRIKASATNPDLADAAFAEQLLIDLPFNNSQSSGSHNGGALEFGSDGKLYITTGDGWEGEFAGDSVQSLSTFTGKVLRIEAGGEIPADNPFCTDATNSFCAIYALGLRNPYSMSRHPDTGVLYINEARGNNKASIYIVAAMANYQHEGTGIGNTTAQWADASGAGGELITGGVWMPEGGLGDYPATYNGRYFVALWGSNSSATGRINTLTSDANPQSTTFATGLGIAGSNGIPVKPVITRINSEGDLFYMLTTYTTGSGQIRQVRYTAQQTVAAPQFDPPGGNSIEALTVGINSSTPAAEIRFTTDNSMPNQSSGLYSSPIGVSTSTILRARAFKEGFNASAETSAVYIIGDQSGNLPPNVNAGVDTVSFVGQTITLDGSGTTDPDGEDDFLTDEQWRLLSGPTVSIEDATEEIAFFIPTEVGIYEFELSISDGVDAATDTVIHTVLRAPRVERGIQVLYTFEEGGGHVIGDVSAVGAPLDLAISTPETAELNADGGLRITGIADIASVGASKMINACTASNAMSVEAWVETNSIDQSGPGPVRIVTLSSNTTNRNFTLGQENDRFDVRLRTNTTNNNGEPSITVPASTVKLALTHVMYSRDAAGAARIYINGVPQVVGTVSGNLMNWDAGYDLRLGNEATLDREWLGDLYLVAVYCEALSANEVQQNYSAGLPPYDDEPDQDEDGVIDLLDNCPSDANASQENFDGDEFGDVCDTDRDNDGIPNAIDLAEKDNHICADADADLCDDCSIGIDGFGPLSDALIANDGDDLDGDGLCDIGDTDDDADGISDTADNCPRNANPNQSDSDGNGIGNACDTSTDLCWVVPADNSRLALICL
jgi:hypothetical protein